MKLPNKIRDCLINGVCTSTTLREAVRMIAVLEVIFALGFMCHGGYLFYSGSSDDKIFGVLYLFSGFIYWSLIWMLWMASDKPTYFRCRMCIMSSVFNQFLIIALTVTRNTITEAPGIISANIWIVCALFLQFYMIGVVWAYMLDFQQNECQQGKRPSAAADQKPFDVENNAKGITVTAL